MIEPMTMSVSRLLPRKHLRSLEIGSAASKLTAEVHGVINKIPIKFPLPNSNGCKDSGITCPLVPGQMYTYKDTLFIQSIYPLVSIEKFLSTDAITSSYYGRSRVSTPRIELYPQRSSVFQVSVVVQWNLKDENGTPVFCVVVPAKIGPQ